jgi:hypothetical protein
MLSGKQGGLGVKLDDAVLAVLEELGPGNSDTEKGIRERLSGRVYEALERLAKA